MPLITQSTAGEVLMDFDSLKGVQARPPAFRCCGVPPPGPAPTVQADMTRPVLSRRLRLEACLARQPLQSMHCASAALMCELHD